MSYHVINPSQFRQVLPKIRLSWLTTSKGLQECSCDAKLRFAHYSSVNAQIIYYKILHLNRFSSLVYGHGVRLILWVIGNVICVQTCRWPMRDLGR